MKRHSNKRSERKKKLFRSFFKHWQFDVIALNWPVVFVLLVGGIFYILEKILDVVLGRIFRRRAEQPASQESHKE